MEGARIIRVEARRPDLRLPLARDFAKRLEGQTVYGNRPPRQVPDGRPCFRDVLLMHLGMSGSFRVSQEHVKARPGKFHHAPPGDRAHDHVVFHMSSGATVTYNDPRRFGLMLIVPRRDLASHPLMRDVRA